MSPQSLYFVQGQNDKYVFHALLCLFSSCNVIGNLMIVHWYLVLMCVNDSKRYWVPTILGIWLPTHRMWAYCIPMSATLHMMMMMLCGIDAVDGHKL